MNVCACACVCLFVRVLVYVYLFMYVYVGKCGCVCLCVFVRERWCVHTCMFARTHDPNRRGGGCNNGNVHDKASLVVVPARQFAGHQS